MFVFCRKCKVCFRWLTFSRARFPYPSLMPTWPLAPERSHVQELSGELNIIHYDMTSKILQFKAFWVFFSFSVHLLGNVADFIVSFLEFCCAQTRNLGGIPAITFTDWGGKTDNDFNVCIWKGLMFFFQKENKENKEEQEEKEGRNP